MEQVQIQKATPRPRFHKYAEMLRHPKHRQIVHYYTDMKDGRCAIGEIMSQLGWDGGDAFDYATQITADIGLVGRRMIQDMNDEGMSWAYIADRLDSL